MVATAEPQTVTVTPDAQATIAMLAAAYYADLGGLAQSNATVPLSSGAQLTVAGGSYLVSPLGTAPGNTLTAIAAYFGVTEAAVTALNLKISDWGDLPAYTAIRLPVVTLTVGTSAGGSTLGSIAQYYGTDVVSVLVDNQDVPGLFAGPLTVEVGPFTSSSTLPPESQPLEIQRPTPSASATDPQGRLLNLFSLLGYQIAGNQDFDVSNLGAPVGPTGGGGSGVGKLRRPNLLGAGDTWTYDVALRYAAALPAGVTGPYAGVGRLLQVGFSWLDMFGNTLITDLSDPQPGDGTPLNLQPVLLGYTDPLLGVGQWPSVSPAWYVDGAPGAAVLHLQLSFDASQYTGTDGPANAGRDLPRYTLLAAQLADPLGVSVTVQSSLATEPLALDTAEFAALTSWVGSIETFLAAIAPAGSIGSVPGEQAAGLSATPPAAILDCPFDLTANLNPAQLMELTCAVTISRTGGRPQAEFAAMPGIASTTTTVAPSGADSASGLQTFAGNFENALTSSTSVLKVAAGPNRFEGGAATPATLWAVLVGLSDTTAIGYSVTDSGSPVIFAPAPISTQLISEAGVEIYPYVPGTGINYQAGTPQNFTDIDLDQWVRTAFAAVDSLLSPQYISALLILDSLTDGNELASLQAHKASLAGMYAQQLQPVFQAQQSASNASVTPTFEQTMLQQLSNAYSTQAALQFEADVVADIVEDPSPAEPPNLYGAIVQNGAPVPGIAFSTAKVPLATATGVPLTFLVSTPAQTAGFQAASAISVDLAYVPSEVEHQIGLVPGIDSPVGSTPYYASTWLQFVNPLPAAMTAALGSFEVPMVLRAYPASPALLTQTGAATDPTASDVVDLTEWTYSLTYSLGVHYPQDTVYGTVLFNVQVPPALAAAELADSFAALAEFVTVFPAVSVDLDGALAQLTPASEGQSVQTALGAVNAVNSMLNAIVTGSTGTAERFTVRSRRRRFGSATGASWEFSIREEPAGAGDGSPLVVTVLPISGPAPEVLIAGYTAQPYQQGTPPPGATQYCYTDSTTGAMLSFEQAQVIGPRSVAYPNLPVLDQQDALATIWVTRNENLVSDPAVVTNPAFVFRTPDVAFSSPLQPTVAPQSDRPGPDRILER